MEGEGITSWGGDGPIMDSDRVTECLREFVHEFVGQEVPCHFPMLVGGAGRARLMLHHYIGADDISRFHHFVSACLPREFQAQSLLILQNAFPCLKTEQTVHSALIRLAATGGMIRQELDPSLLFDFCEFYAGDAVISQHALSKGLNVLSFDIKTDLRMDLLKPWGFAWHVLAVGEGGSPKPR